MLSKRVRDLCLSFPKEAQGIVEGYGIEVNQFNAMLDRAERNPFLRWRVSRAVRRMATRKMGA